MTGGYFCHVILLCKEWYGHSDSDVTTPSLPEVTALLLCFNLRVVRIDLIRPCFVYILISGQKSYKSFSKMSLLSTFVVKNSEIFYTKLILIWE